MPPVNDRPPHCPYGYHYDANKDLCVVNAPPIPPPIPPPPSDRLGNPSVSNMISFEYEFYGIQPSIQGLAAGIETLEPFPPIPGGEPTRMILTSDKAIYYWDGGPGSDGRPQPATLQATLTYVADGAPLVGREIVFVYAGTNKVARTDSTGTAQVTFTPFDVPNPPAPGEPGGNETFYAQCSFLGY
jgi:hypothetical protein